MSAINKQSLFGRTKIDDPDLHVSSFLHKKGHVLCSQFHDERAIGRLLLNSGDVVA
jgi:hypothetical protein